VSVASLIVSEHNIDEWPNAGLSPIPGKSGTYKLWFHSAGIVHANQSEVPRISSTEQEWRGAPLVARNVKRPSMTRVALYARYSSDNQRDASIEDQFRDLPRARQPQDMEDRQHL
jgi:hypothetical protein